MLTPGCRYLEQVEEPLRIVEQKVRGILDEVGGLRVPAETLGADSDLFAAGLTSFATVGVMLALEEEFDVAFPDSLLVRSTFSSVRSLTSAVQSLGGHANG